MTNCPRCQHPVDEKARTTCPVCFAPLPSAAVPALPPLPAPAAQQTAPPVIPPMPIQPPPTPGYAPALPPSRGVPIVPGAPPVGAYYAPLTTGRADAGVNGGMAGMPPPAPSRPGRVALTGEVVADSASYSGSGAGSVSGGLPPLPNYSSIPAPSSRPMNPYAPAPAYKAPNSFSPYLKIRLAILAVGLMIALFARLARIIGSGDNGQPGSSSPGFSLPYGGGTNPESASLKTPNTAASSVMQAMHVKDWRRLYYLCAFENNERKSASEAGDFQTELNRVAMMNHNPLAIINLMAAASDFSAGDGNIHGNRADVPTSWTIPYNGETLKLNGTAHLVQQDGNWELDLTSPGLSTMDSMLGTVTSRTGHGPEIVIPHFDPIMPHTIPMHGNPAFSPPRSNPPAMPSNPYPAQPNFPPYRPPQYMPPTHFVPPPRFGPNNFPRGPQFGPSPAPGGYNNGGSYSSAGGGYNAPNGYNGANGVPANQAQPGSSAGESTPGNGPSPANGENGGL